MLDLLLSMKKVLQDVYCTASNDPRLWEERFTDMTKAERKEEEEEVTGVMCETEM